MPAIATITPVSEAAGTTGYELWALSIPDYGSPPTAPQLSVEVLQPVNVDGSRYRVGGAHFPEFQLLGVIPAESFASAGATARAIEQLQGKQVSFQYTRAGATAYTFYVKSARALATGKRILGATAASSTGNASPGPSPQSAALGSVEISLVMQGFAP